MQNLINTVSNWIFLAFICGIPIFAALRKVNVFDSFVTGARQSFKTSLNIIPYLIAMMVAVGMLRASGFFDILYNLLSPVLEIFGMPKELLPLALIRPFSGSASTAIMADIIHTEGGDSLISKTAATMMGSTETTFYVIAVYFGSIRIKKTRHAIPAGLLADLTGIIVSIIVCRYLFI